MKYIGMIIKYAFILSYAFVTIMFAILFAGMAYGAYKELMKLL